MRNEPGAPSAIAVEAAPSVVAPSVVAPSVVAPLPHPPELPGSSEARSETRVLDCTIRDGGLMNRHRFEDEVVRAVYLACAAAGIDYMEIGYRASRRDVALREHGCWKFCREEDIRRIVGDRPSGPKLSVMADAGKCDYRDDISPKKDSVVDLVRVACYHHQIPLALDMLEHARDMGYETTANLMAVSTLSESELDAALDLLADSKAEVVYVVDSFGALHGGQVPDLVRKYLGRLAGSGKHVGIHAHNNLQLAYANTIEAALAGATHLDATMAGLGRGAGNCPMELLLGFLRDPKYDLRPVLDCVERTIEPIRGDLKWGFDLPYMLTGLFNQHPRAAIEFNAATVRGDIGSFFETVTESR
ncbi:MAG: aldolase catalytic domain-containing protein [Verrucomicrobiales bacterium]